MIGAECNPPVGQKSGSAFDAVFDPVRFGRLRNADRNFSATGKKKKTESAI
ncbi:MAG: hypothetical protein JW795_19790 [Chitinivibrionales bacterium]|nr:hypothetical protein [Chitinivibrionales bacterium]